MESDFLSKGIKISYIAVAFFPSTKDKDGAPGSCFLFPIRIHISLFDI